MRSAYLRTAFGVGVLYALFAAIQTAFLSVAAAIAARRLILPMLASGEWLEFPDLFRQMLSDGWISALLVFYVIGMVVGMLVGIRVFRAIRGNAVPLEKHSMRPGQYLLLIPVTFGFWAIGVIPGNITAILGLDTGTDILTRLFGDLGAAAWPMWIYTCIGAPILEELALRKTLLDRIHVYGHGYAALVSGLLFGLIHGNSGQFFLAFSVGVLFAVIYLFSGNVAHTIVLHACINTLVTVPEILRAFGIEAQPVWNFLLPAIGVAGVVILILNRKQFFAQLTPSRVPDAHRAVWRNAGMIVMTILGLLNLVTTDLMMVLLQLLEEVNLLTLVQLVSTALAVALVLLLPVFSKRLTAPPEEAEIVTNP